MRIIIKYIIISVFVSTGTIMLFSSCDREEEPYLLGKHRLSDKEENNDPGISFDIESDEMYEDVEELHFDADKWGEERMDVDL